MTRKDTYPLSQCEKKRTPAPDKDFVKSAARGRWRWILRELDIDPIVLTGQHTPCPGCGGKDRFRFDDRDGDGTFICSQGTGKVIAGDGFEFIRHISQLSFPVVLRLVAQILGVDGGGVVRIPKARKSVKPANTRSAKEESTKDTYLERVLAECKPVSPTGVVVQYLSARGLADIRADLPRSLYEHPALSYYENGRKIGEYPAMVAEVRSVEGELICLHRTYLSHSGDAKAPVSEPKKLSRVQRTGQTLGGAIRLYEAGAQVALAEGIESALSVRLYCGWPIWACLSAQGLRSVELPPEISTVRIFGDADKAGLEAGAYAKYWLRGEGRNVEWETPRVDGFDFLDVWNAAHERERL
jgi:putative DNA primase/helicase